MKYEIHHRPSINTERVCELYSEKDGVPVTYIGTTALDMGVVESNVFFRETPHPEFGNRYFGLRYTEIGLGISDADVIEDLTFEMVLVNDKLYYSMHRWDYFNISDTLAIDGGRAYLKLSGSDLSDVTVMNMKVKDGKWING